MHSGVELTVEGDGRTYTWSIQTDATWRGRRISYWADFQTDKGIPSTVQIPFAKFYPQFRGFKLDGPPIDKSEISEFSLYIYDKKDGPFSIKLFSVGAY